MIGNTISKFLFEAFGEDMAVGAAKRIWNMVLGIFSSEAANKVRQKVVETINSRGWEDEGFFELDLAQTTLVSAKKKILEDGMRLAERYDLIRGTHVARNFRIIVTLNDKNPNITNPRAGVAILQDLGERCNKAKEVFLSMYAAGAMHDPKFTFEHFSDVCQKELFPFLIKEFKDAYKSMNSSSKALAREIGKERRAEEHEENRINRMPNGFRKIVAHTIFTIKKYAID